MTEFLGRLLGVENLEAIRGWRLGFTAPWAEGRPALVLFACAAMAALAVFFYFRYQKTGPRRARLILAGLRAVVLAALVAILAEPVVIFDVDEKPKPLLPVVFDGTESMDFRDKLSADDLAALTGAIGDQSGATLAELDDVSRLELIKKVLSSEQNRVLQELAEKYRVRAYIMDQRDEVRELTLFDDTAEQTPADDQPRPAAGSLAQTPSARPGGTGAADVDERIDSAHVVDQLSAAGRVTAIEAALNDLRRRHRRHIAGIVMFSDFYQNAGEALRAAERVNVPIHTVGVGPREVIDLSVAIESEVLFKKDEVKNVVVKLDQSGLAGRAVRVQLYARRLGSEEEAVPVSQSKTVTLTEDPRPVELPYKPDQEGRFMLSVDVEPFDEEVLVENNTAEREISVQDQALKLLFVEYEPTWEWRFVKEVFHRDKLVGREGFRTYLDSADFRVRHTNEFFLETLARPRHEFFSYDVIFLSDMPAEKLSDRFQDMLREYVADFGGGLVVMAGPRFGPGALAQTKIADMLPVVVDPTARLRNGEYRMQFTPRSNDYGFVRLGEPGNDRENRKAWDNLGRVPWYQPVLRPDSRADVLAVHPTDKCVDNVTPQPLIAVSRYGKGEVVYLGHNEFWRLRRKYGEKYYRQFWAQMIYRLGLGRALGEQKRFRLETDRESYDVGDKARIIVEAYDENFQTFDRRDVADVSDDGSSGDTTGRRVVDRLEAKLITEGAGGNPIATEFTLPRRDDRFFETELPIHARGRHRILVRDPVTQEETEINFTAAPVSLERRRAVRNYQLQKDLAATTGGRHYELHEVSQLLADLNVEPPVERTSMPVAFWNTWLVLIIALALMLVEWFTRKMWNMQ